MTLPLIPKCEKPLLPGLCKVCVSGFFPLKSSGLYFLEKQGWKKPFKDSGKYFPLPPTSSYQVPCDGLEGQIMKLLYVGTGVIYGK